MEDDDTDEVDQSDSDDEENEEEEEMISDMELETMRYDNGIKKIELRENGYVDYKITKIIEQSKYIPLRLDFDERNYYKLLEAALSVSEYTDKVKMIM